MRAALWGGWAVRCRLARGRAWRPRGWQHRKRGLRWRWRQWRRALLDLRVQLQVMLLIIVEVGVAGVLLVLLLQH